jgi:hypothetical protein
MEIALEIDIDIVLDLYEPRWILQSNARAAEGCVAGYTNALSAIWARRASSVHPNAGNDPFTEALNVKAVTPVTTSQNHWLVRLKVG